MSTVDVRFEDLTISAQVMVASRSLPTLKNTFLNRIEVRAYKLHVHKAMGR